MTDRFDELLSPAKARGLRSELERLFPRRTLIPVGCIYAYAEPERVGRFPVRTDIEVQPSSAPRMTTEEFLKNVTIVRLYP